MSDNNANNNFENLEFNNSQNTFRIVLTGGPCAGKTSSLSLISDHFRNLGWNVYCVPEAATLLVGGGGISWAHLNEEQGFSLQKNVLKLMLQIEDTYYEIASKNSKKSLIISDRGTMDCSAYVDKETFDRILKEIGISSTFEIKENRYDMVIHLFSAAIGAEDHYHLANNKVRTETADQAREVDKQILKAWTGHPSITCIDNRTIFKEKVLRAVQAICKKVGAPIIGDSNIKRKLKIMSVNDNEAAHNQIHYCDSECEYTYLLDGEETQHRVRRRSANGGSIYTHIIRAKLENGKYSESTRSISRREYDSLLLLALPSNHTILTQKRSFVYQNQYFNLLIYKNICEGLMILEIYEDPAVELRLPTDLFTIEKEVTHDPAYSMFNLSKKELCN